MGQLTKNEVFALAVQRYSDAVYRAPCTIADARPMPRMWCRMYLKSSCITRAALRVRSISRRGCCGWPSTLPDLTRAAHQKDTELDENLPAPEQMEDGSVLDAVKAPAGELPQRHLLTLL